MNNLCKVKHVFPGGNTTKGFYSFYDYILSQDEANHIFCIKGGPGVGKSSLMKKIGQKMIDLGVDVEYHHCSSDPNSLDALVIPKLKLALIDGTSPHIVDPKNPGAVDEVVNLGFWDEIGIKEYRNNIIETNRENSRLFNKAYNYLRAAKEVYDAYEFTEGKAFNTSEYNKIIENTVNEIFVNKEISDNLGKDRHLFGYALTPIGITEYRDTLICNYKTRYLIKESPGASSEKLMNEIVSQAIKRGIDIECYHSPIKVEKIEDLLLPELNIAVSVINNYHEGSFEYNKEIDLTKLLNKDVLNFFKDEIDEDKELFEMLLFKGLSFINKAKGNHDHLETYYISNMNFEKVNEQFDDLMNRILSYMK